MHLDDVMRIEQGSYAFPWSRGNFIDSLAAGYWMQVLRDADRNLAAYIVAMPGVATKLEHIPADLDKHLVKNDFAWAAKNRDKILAEWSKRYESKAAPK